MTALGLILCLSHSLLTKQLWYKSREHYNTRFGKTSQQILSHFSAQTSWKGLTIWTSGRTTTYIQLATTYIQSILTGTNFDFKRSNDKFYISLFLRGNSFITHSSPIHHKLKCNLTKTRHLQCYWGFTPPTSTFCTDGKPQAPALWNVWGHCHLARAQTINDRSRVMQNLGQNVLYKWNKQSKWLAQSQITITFVTNRKFYVESLPKALY